MTTDSIIGQLRTLPTAELVKAARANAQLHSSGAHTHSLPGITPAPDDYVEALAERLGEAEAETDGYDRILSRQSDLLTGVANALNGPPPELTTWSHHDLPQKAAQLVDDRKRLCRERDEARAERNEVYRETIADARASTAAMQQATRAIDDARAAIARVNAIADEMAASSNETVKAYGVLIRRGVVGATEEGES